MGNRRTVAALGALLIMAGTTAGCGQTVAGHGVSVYDNAFQVAGLPTTGGPSGPRPGAPASARTAVDGDGGEFDTTALNAVDDIEAYWRDEYHTAFADPAAGPFTPPETFYSWNARAPRVQETQFCGATTDHLVNAAYCRNDNSIGWDRGALMPMMKSSFGPMAEVMVLAHEYGHAIQSMAHLVAATDPMIVREQQADCFAGAFMRHVAEGKAAHFTLNTSDGLNSVLAATVSIRDTDPGDVEAVHGSAFERVSAVQIGFTDGPTGCKKIDMADVNRRRKGLPQSFDGDQQHGELAVTQRSLTVLSHALTTVMPLPTTPVFDYSGAQLSCGTAKGTEPVSYCPDDDTIGTDVPALAQRGAVPEDQDEFPSRIDGDYNAYVVFVSRYTLAVQHAAGQNLTGAKAGLRAACLSGVISAALADPSRTAADGDIALSADDLDKAVSGLLSDGLAASDIQGNTVPSGFSRVDAFRAGVLGTQQTCQSRYA